MPQFSYKARSTEGESVSGMLEAQSGSEATRLLMEKGLTPLSIQNSSVAAASSNAAPATPSEGFKLFEEKADPLDCLLFSQQMSALLKAGVPILRALTGIQESSPNPRFSNAVKTIRENLDAGKPLSACLAKQPDYFSPYYLSMIRVGEMTGRLDEVFDKLHEHLEFQRQMKAQVKAAVRYPIIVIVVMLAALMIINFFVIPAFAKVYAGFKADLPIFTKILIGTSNFLLDYWWMLAVILGLLFTAFTSWKHSESGNVIWDRWVLKFPIAGKIVHKAVMARFCRSMSLSMQSGVPISSALGLVADSSDNLWIAQRLSSLKIQIERGDSLHRSCTQSGVFTPIALQMILVGEESGSLDKMLIDVSRLYQTQVEYELKTLGAQIEPILILFMGVLVLVLALGVFLPIWNLSSAAFPHK